MNSNYPAGFTQADHDKIFTDADECCPFCDTDPIVPVRRFKCDHIDCKGEVILPDSNFKEKIYCPLCLMQLPDDYQLITSCCGEDLGVL